ncbi:MAG: ABC transporter ATP-binding protein [Candidatus Spyradocola sp.]|jgi:peptide/nickel transport system ATP-binding protein
MEAEKILEVKNLSTSFRTERGIMKAIDGVSFYINRGEILGMVGESGCGKSVTSQSILRLYDEKRQVKYSGEILFANKNLLTLSEKEMQNVRGNDVAMVFQDALSSLNPVFTVGHQIMDTLRIHQGMKNAQAREKAIEMLRLVGIPSPEKRVDQYPHELSGGMRQRVMIAIALACQPKLLIADEPTTALDVTIQAQIMDLILELNRKLNMGVMLITHDLSVVAEVCSRVAVMYLGQIVEEASVNDIFDNPGHPYTMGLIRSIPKIEGEREKRLYQIKGTVPMLSQIPQGCRFAPRCPRATEECRKQMPDLVSVSDTQRVRCWHAGKESA